MVGAIEEPLDQISCGFILEVSFGITPQTGSGTQDARLFTHTGRVHNDKGAGGERDKSRVAFLSLHLLDLEIGYAIGRPPDGWSRG